MPKTIILEEFKEIDVPESLLLSTGEVSVFPTILEKNFFTIKYKKGKATFQAGGYVGIIPINSELSIDIRPKVPISNLERIVFLSNHRPQILKEFKRRYDPHEYSSASLSEFLADCFLKAMEELCANGLLKVYDKKTSAGLFPKGRIDFAGTIKARSKTNGASIVSHWFDRSTNTAPNQLLKAMTLLLLKNPTLMKDKERKRSALYILNNLSNISERQPDLLLQHPTITNPENHIPSTKSLYLDAISLAKIILQGRGLSFISGQSTTASALVLNIAVAFEWYILAVLKASKYNNSQFKVLDGNIGGIGGGKKELLTPSASELYIGKIIDATPDIVISINEAQTNIVIDVKYKSIKDLPDRDDLNQIISYAASYNSSYGVLIYPANEHNKTGIRSLGKISKVEFFQYFIDLDRADIESEEEALVNVIASLTGYTQASPAI